MSKLRSSRHPMTDIRYMPSALSVSIPEKCNPMVRSSFLRRAAFAVIDVLPSF